MKQQSIIEKTAFFGIMGALALIMSFIENMFIPDIPFLPVGAKPGLSNVVTVCVIELTGFGGGIYITLIKALFAFITRGTTASLMSLCGGLFSTVATSMLIKKRDKLFSFIGIGIIGAQLHNFGQLAVACVLSGTPALFGYGKYLMIFALITGSVSGVMLTVVMPQINKAARYYVARKKKVRSR